MIPPNGKPVSAGIVRRRAHQTSTPDPAHPGDTLAVTVEPAGGSPAADHPADRRPRPGLTLTRREEEERGGDHRAARRDAAMWAMSGSWIGGSEIAAGASRLPLVRPGQALALDRAVALRAGTEQLVELERAVRRA